jgi:hypothetical protein
VRLTLLAALIKFERFEWIIEKATELGVTAIVPFQAARSEKGLDLAARKRLVRWRTIALEASQQARRRFFPPCHHAAWSPTPWPCWPARKAAGPAPSAPWPGRPAGFPSLWARTSCAPKPPPSRPWQSSPAHG